MVKARSPRKGSSSSYYNLLGRGNILSPRIGHGSHDVEAMEVQPTPSGIP